MAAPRAWRAIAALALLLSVPVVVPPDVSAQAPSADELSRIFKEGDRNGDGRLDREEFYRVIVETFYVLDRNKDGYLVVAEVTELTVERFRGADRDGDGRLSLQEYVNALFKDFDAADADKDGVLTYQELEIYIRTAPR